MSDTDLELLALYTRQKAEDAFTELVRRHLGLVYSTALRQVRSPQLAEEVAQGTFVKLAQKARQLAHDTILSGWLYQVTYHEAIDVARREARRQLREQIATEMNAINATADDWLQIEPILDEAMQALDETDRAAILLRFFENKSLREVGHTLGTSEDGAQKRVSRAIERLREFLTRRGVTLGASALIMAISANAAQGAPAALVQTFASSALSAAAATSTATKGLILTTAKKIMFATTIGLVGLGIYEARKAAVLHRQPNKSVFPAQAATANAQTPPQLGSEPVWQGKTVTEWLDRLQIYDLQTNPISGVAVLPRSPDRVAHDPALQALIAIGPKAVPVLQARIMDRADWDPAERSSVSLWAEWFWLGVRNRRFAKNTPAPNHWSQFQQHRKDSAAYVLMVLGTNAQAGFGRLAEAYAAAPKRESISGTSVSGTPVGLNPYRAARMAAKTHPQRRAELVAEIVQAMQHTNAWCREIALLCAQDLPEEFLSWEKEFIACITDKDPIVQGQALGSIVLISGCKEKPPNMPRAEIQTALAQVIDDSQTSERHRDIARAAQRMISGP